jgi:5,10-methylenetetrahydromethanopterin reductase
MKFSIRLNNDLPLADYLRLAAAAEAAGFDQFWVSNDLFLRSALAILPAIVQATSRIAIGSCILNPYTIHPAELASFAATLDELSGGRFNLGLAAGAADFLGWVGIEQARPVAAMRETVAAVNLLTSGRPAALNGRFLQWGEQAYLRFAPLRRTPIYLGALSAQMLGLLGELADGGLPLLFPPEHYATVLPLIAAGAARAGRELQELDLAACIWCSVGHERAAAEAVLRDKIAYYGHALSPLILERLGLTRADFAPIERALRLQRNPAKARALVNEAMLRIGVVGTPRDLIARLEGLVAQGARHLSFGPPLGPDPLAAIEALGREVIPHFRS